MKVTQYERQVKTNPVSGHRLSLPEDTFGQSIAKGLGDIGSAFGGVAKALKDQADSTAVEERVTEDNRQLRDALYGQNGFMTQQGANAMGLTTKYDEFSNKVMDKSLGAFANESQRRLYKQRMAAHNEAVRNSLLNHEFRQVQAHGKAVKVAHINGLGEGIVFSSGTPDLYNQNMSDYITNVAQFGQQYLGLRGEALKQYTDKAVSQSVVASVQYQLNTEQNVDRANQIFEDAKKRGMLTGADAIQLGQSMGAILKAHQSKLDGAELAELYAQTKSPEFQLGKQIADAGYVTSEIKKQLDNASSDEERNAIYMKIGSDMSVRNGGDIEGAFQMAMLGDGVWDGSSMEDVSAKAKSFANRFRQTPEMLTPVTQRQALRMVVDNPKYANRTPEEQAQIAKSLVDGVQAYVAREDAKRANKVALLKKGIDSNRTLAEQDVTGLTTRQVTALNFYQSYAKKGVYDYATQNALWENSGQLAMMSDADFEAVMLTVAPDVAAAMRQERERVLNPDTEKSPPPEKEIRDMAMAEIFQSNPDLAKDENRAAREVLLYGIVERVKKRTDQLQRRPDRKELVALVHESMPTYIGRPDLTWFESEKALEQHPKLSETLEDIAEIVGVNPSNPYALIQLGQRIKMDDPRVRVPNRVYVEALLSKEEKGALFDQEKKFGQLNPIQILSWLIDKRAGVKQNAYGITSDNTNLYQNLNVDEVY